MNTSTQTVDTSNNRAKNQLMRDLITKPMDINSNTSPTTKPGISSKAKKLKASFQVSKVSKAALECATPRCNTGKIKKAIDGHKQGDPIGKGKSGFYVLF